MITILKQFIVKLLLILSLFTPTHTTFAGKSSAWLYSRCTDLYDTPSGKLDLGYYVVSPGAIIIAHTATSSVITATTTQMTPDAIRVVAIPPNGFTVAHVIGTRCIDTFSDGISYIGSSTINAALSSQPNASVPDEAIDAAAGSAL